MTVCPQLFAALNGAFSRKYNSLSQYIVEARPYVAAGAEGVLTAVKEAAAEDKQFADRIAGVIEQLEGVPQLAIFNPEVASLNYLALDYLAAVLRRELETQLAEYEQGAALAAEVPLAGEVFQDLIAATRGQLGRLPAQS